MKRFSQLTFIFCGILLTFAAFPVFAQNETAQEIKINKQPLQDLGAFVRDKIERGDLDLTEPFKVVVEGVLNKDGRLDKDIDKQTKKPKSQFTVIEGEERIVTVAKTAIEAVSNSGWFGFLRNLGAEKLKITFAQDKDKIFVIAESEQATAEKANTMASALNILISAAKQYSNIDEDSKIILNGFKPATNGKIVIINFAIPAKTAHDMIERNLEKAAEKEKWSGE